MIKKLTHHGNSLALVIDRPILDLVNINPDDPLEISTDDGRRLIISPVKDPERAKKFRDALERVNRKHHKTLKRLAE
jgi:antitoxin MazE